MWVITTTTNPFTFFLERKKSKGKKLLDGFHPIWTEQKCQREVFFLNFSFPHISPSEEENFLPSLSHSSFALQKAQRHYLAHWPSRVCFRRKVNLSLILKYCNDPKEPFHVYMCIYMLIICCLCKYRYPKHITIVENIDTVYLTYLLLAHSEHAFDAYNFLFCFSLGSVYMGVDFCKKLCGVSIVRRWDMNECGTSLISQESKIMDKNQVL